MLVEVDRMKGDVTKSREQQTTCDSDKTVLQGKVKALEEGKAAGDKATADLATCETSAKEVAANVTELTKANAAAVADLEKCTADMKAASPKPQI
jgi:hypothetical protein